ncbi:transposase [Enterococcus faecalis]|uniref:transposase n=1 Tax=Enterococcus faecalis TaxID=1351 RepID=UPI001D186E08|nr:transposase [Enterococcus faecalis]MCC4085733.1 transposase [Enterococcus faecalis]
MKNHFKGKQYVYRIIIEAVGLYYHFPLSYRDYGQPHSIVTDKYAPSLKAVKELKEEGTLADSVNHWKSKYLNNILEQDHCQVKGKFPYGNSFQSTYTAATTIKGIEVVSALYKESRREINLFDFSPWEGIENLLIAA